tara:strand:+ start:28642 stop:28794 length:153 start_codon:yes stop_codon:yes gene_type:complete
MSKPTSLTVQIGAIILSTLFAVAGLVASGVFFRLLFETFMLGFNLFNMWG